MKLGVIIRLDENVEEKFLKAEAIGFSTCQLSCWDTKLMNSESAAIVSRASKKSNVEITAFWCGWPGPVVWNFYDAPMLIGLVPKEYRFVRMEAIKTGSDFAKMMSVDKIVTHVGFIPENANSECYRSLIPVLRAIANKAGQNGQAFLFETGQETPITLKRAIDDIGCDNIGVNFDPANLLMYGKGNPADALDILGGYVLAVHAKDGEYPVDGMHLGEEKVIGEGSVNLPVIIKKLKEIGYDDAITIEREIVGERQTKDILTARDFLAKII